MDHSQFEGKRFVVEVALSGSALQFYGIAARGRDEALGPVMRITPEPGNDSVGSPILLIRENSFSANVRPDEKHDCDFRISLTGDKIVQ